MGEPRVPAETCVPAALAVRSHPLAAQRLSAEWVCPSRKFWGLALPTEPGTGQAHPCARGVPLEGLLAPVLSYGDPFPMGLGGQKGSKTASLSSPPCRAMCRGRDGSRVGTPRRATSGPRPHGGAGQLRGPIPGTGKPSLCSGTGWRAPLLCGPSGLLLGTQAAPPPSPRPHHRSFGGQDTSPHSLGSKFTPPLLTFCSCGPALPWA